MQSTALEFVRLFNEKLWWNHKCKERKREAATKKMRKRNGSKKKHTNTLFKLCHSAWIYSIVSSLSFQQYTQQKEHNSQRVDFVCVVIGPRKFPSYFFFVNFFSIMYMLENSGTTMNFQWLPLFSTNINFFLCSQMTIFILLVRRLFVRHGPRLYSKCIFL